MSSFTTPLEVEATNEIGKWKLTEPFEYVVGSLENPEDIIKIPAGFITDFASTPRFLWSIFPPFGKYGKAAVLHDYLYGTQKYSRKKCDKTFLEAMGVLKVPKWKRYMMYYAVRLFGRSHYSKNDK